MKRTRWILAVVVAAAGLGAAGCGSDDVNNAQDQINNAQDQVNSVKQKATEAQPTSKRRPDPRIPEQKKEIVVCCAHPDTGRAQRMSTN